jgi:hypothetical protein
MVERFFFDGINSKTARATIAGHDDFIFQILPHEAQTTLVFMKFTISGTEIALNALIFELMPIVGFYCIVANKSRHYYFPGILK